MGKYHWKIASAICLLSLNCEAAILDVYCVRENCPAISKALSNRVHVLELDAAGVVSDRLSASIAQMRPQTPEQGREFVNRLINSPDGRKELLHVQNSLNAVEKAIRWELKKIPAYVCNDQAVIYGGSTLQALRDCERYLSQVGSQ